MSFTFNEDLTDDLDYVRYHSGDVVEDESFLSDELITSLIATSASRNAAVISALRFIITRLSQPNFRADWLQVDNATARAGYETMLKEKKNELGIGGPRVEVVHPYRVDSAQTEEPDYTDGRP